MYSIILRSEEKKSPTHTRGRNMFSSSLACLMCIKVHKLQVMRFSTVCITIAYNCNILIYNIYHKNNRNILKQVDEKSDI